MKIQVLWLGYCDPWMASVEHSFSLYRPLRSTLPGFVVACQTCRVMRQNLCWMTAFVGDQGETDGNKNAQYKRQQKPHHHAITATEAIIGCLVDLADVWAAGKEGRAFPGPEEEHRVANARGVLF